MGERVLILESFLLMTPARSTACARSATQSSMHKQPPQRHTHSVDNSRKKVSKVLHLLTRPPHPHNLGRRCALWARLLGLQDGSQLGVADQARENDKWGAAMIMRGFRSCARLSPRCRRWGLLSQGIPGPLRLGRYRLLLLLGSNAQPRLCRELYYIYRLLGARPQDLQHKAFDKVSQQGQLTAICQVVNPRIAADLQGKSAVS